MTITTKQPGDNKIYQKQNSFDTFVSMKPASIAIQTQRVLAAIAGYNGHTYPQDVLEAVVRNLKLADTSNAEFKLTIPIADDIAKLEGHEIVRYVYHRYRYDVYPVQKILDDFPPYLQIEPSSVCNFRCVFCYQTDQDFTRKGSEHMGMMSFGLFKEIIDQIEQNVEFISLASRGEPFVCKDIDQMLEYCRGKFLGLKVNTNASLLTEKHCHALLCGGVNTVVFSADAAEEPLYSQLRVGGKLDKILKNIEMFRSIKEKHYSSSKVISRVSGVKVRQDQAMPSMVKIWGGLVDQVCFVDYNPWEDVYDAAVNDVMTPCSDLWRRMFVWFDGKVNPCDTDFKSTLSVGDFPKKSISQLWRSEIYEKLRQKHLDKKRGTVEPCRRCVVI